MRFVKDFRIIEVSLGVGGSQHSLYTKIHLDGDADKTKSRTMFVGNVDLGRTLSHAEIDGYLRDLLGGFGEIESVSVSHFSTEGANNSSSSSSRKHRHETTRNARFAHVVFVKKTAVKAALAASDADYSKLGLDIGARWGVRDDIRPRRKSEFAAQVPLFDLNPDETREDINTTMMDFEENEASTRKALMKAAREPDSDGFVVAVNKPNKKVRKNTTTESGSGSARGGHQNPRNRGNKKGKGKEKESKELTNFYRFQVKEVRRDQLSDLREKFEKDREKVAAMKASKKSFNPLL